MNTSEAVAQLNRRLPLTTRQTALSVAYRQIHQSILYTLVKHGRGLSHAELATQLGSTEVEMFLQRVVADDLVIVDPQHNAIVGAYPVTTARTPHAIEIYGQHLYAMCALDAVAVAPRAHMA